MLAPLELKTVFIILGSTTMYICICAAVTEQEVRSAIDAGATSVEAVTGACCAGGDCGACHEDIERMIDARWGGEATGAHKSLPIVRERAA